MVVGRCHARQVSQEYGVGPGHQLTFSPGRALLAALPIQGAMGEDQRSRGSCHAVGCKRWLGRNPKDHAIPSETA